MRLFLVLLISMMFGGATSGLASETGMKTLRNIEAQGLRVISPRRMRTLLLPSAPLPSGLEFSKSWLDRQPAATGGVHWNCLAEALYFEARGETVKGQFAVAEVILNRVASARFPQTICGVVNQGTGRRYQCQFTYTCDGYDEAIREPKAYERVAKIARLAMDGAAPALTKGATHYHTTAVRPRWSRTYTRTTRIGSHLFYRHNVRTASN